MGVKLFDLLESTEIDLADLADKKVAIDTSLFLYQFLSSIRQRDGSLLTDSKGRITSHLIGLFSRTTKLMSYGILPCFVFDGKAPELKKKERERRAKLKEEAARKYQIAVEKEDISEMKKFAARTTRLTGAMVEEAKLLVDALGLPIIQAPSEGEAQAAQLVKEGIVFAAASQDADSFMFGCPRLIKNLAITGKKKKAGALAYKIVKPELIELKKVLDRLEITQDQLIALGMLVGTDFNIGGIKGIGPKNAIKLVKKHGKNFTALFEEVKWGDFFEPSWNEVFDVFKHMPVEKNLKLEWKEPDQDKLISILVDEHDFSLERVKNTINNLIKEKHKKQQKNLNKWF